jgi:hypothetical protein
LEEKNPVTEKVRAGLICDNGYSAEDFSTIVDMPPGMHQFKFIVDDEWKCSEDLPVGSDSEGNLVNCLHVQDEDGASIKDGLENITSEYGFEPGIYIS